MIGNIQRNIIVRAVRIRKEQGENPEEVLAGYTRLTEEEKEEIMAEIMPGKE